MLLVVARLRQPLPDAHTRPVLPDQPCSPNRISGEPTIIHIGEGLA
jgi:hypothetical protein